MHGIQICVAILLILSGCDSTEPVAPKEIAVIDVWAHAGQQNERNILEKEVTSFNTNHPDLQLRLTLIPEGSYNAQVQAAAIAGKLPDLLEIDGPFLYRYVWEGQLRTLENLLSNRVLDDLLPSIHAQGSYHGRLWGVGLYDSGLCLYANRALLTQAGIRIPTLEQPWSSSEFDKILQLLAQKDSDGQVLDLKLNYSGEWYTYAFSPFIQSAGGDLVARSGDHHARRVLNGPASVKAMQTLQTWINNGWVDPNIDEAAFVSGRVPLALGGHWNYSEYYKAFGEDLLLLPLPDFGHGPKTGQGSWLWVITADSIHPTAAANFLEYLFHTKRILSITKVNNAIPAIRSAIADSPRYASGGPLNFFVRQLEGGYAVPRPRTPAYPVITAEFQKAFDRIRSGGNVKKSLDRAAEAIDQDIDDNHNYPLVGRAHEESMR